ncbi:titin-like isoform X1, partial [Leptotrombidium deliense]
MEDGWYQCTAQNQAGSTATRARVFVTVEEKSFSEQSYLFLPKPQRVIEPEAPPPSETIYLRHIERAAPHTPHDDDSPQFTEKPKFLVPIKDVRVAEGERVIFETRLLPIGDPALTVEWYLNGRLVEASSRLMTTFRFGYVSLQILYVYKSDIGTYTCRAVNENGEAVTTASLTVTEKSVIDTESQHPESIEAIRHLEDYEHYKRRDSIDESVRMKPRFKGPLRGPEQLTEGQNVHFETRLEPENDESMTVEWYFNGRPLTSGHRFKTYFDFGYVALDILYAYPQDSGTFTVVARNKLGEDVLNKEIRVSAMKTVDTSTLHDRSMHEIQRLEGWKYQRQTDQFDETYGPPKFTTPITGPHEITEGESVHYKCRVTPTDDPDLKVMWFVNDHELILGSRFNFTYDFGYVSLDIAAAMPSDAGIYKCVAVNKAGQDVVTTSLKVKSVGTVITDLGIPEQRQYIEKTEELEEYQKRQTRQAFLDLESTPNQAPVFKTQLVDQLNIMENKTAHFEATLEPQGDPNMKIEWFKDGQLLQASSRITTFSNFGYVALTIKSVDNRDDGVYTCVATNKLGSAQTSARLTSISLKSIIVESQFSEGMEKMSRLEHTKFKAAEFQDQEVNEKPKFIKPLSGPESVKEGQSAHFETRLEPKNDPTMTVEWFHNGKPLRSGHRFITSYDFGYVALDILYAYPEDNGTYTVVAKNKLGEDVLHKQFNVTAAKTIDTSTLHDRSVHEIQRLEGYKYQRPEEPEKTYGPPKFITPISGPHDVTEGDTVHFKCQVIPNDDPDLKVMWFVNERELVLGSRVNLTYDFGYVSLEITCIMPSDAGIYKCVAVNKMGQDVVTTSLKVKSVGTIITDLGIPEQKQYIEKTEELEEYQRRQTRQAFLDLEATPKQAPVFTTQLVDQLNIMENKTAHFEATLEPQGDPNMKIEWYKDGQLLQASSRITTFSNFGYVALTIKSIDNRDDGVYKCVAKNSLGSAETSARLTSVSLKSIIVESQFSEGLEKMSKLEESKFKAAEFHEQEINQKPKFIKPLSGPENVNEGQSAHFETRLEPKGDPTMTVEWFHNGKPLRSGHRFITSYDFGYVALDILYSYPEDNGTFTVVAKNKLGEDVLHKQFNVKASKTIDTSTLHDRSVHEIQRLEAYKHDKPVEPETTYGPPKFTTPISGPQNITEGQSVHFTCHVTPAEDPNLKVMWFVDNRELISGSRFNFTYDFGYVSLEIASAMPYDAGLYRCVAINKAGQDVVTTSLKVKSVGTIITDLGIPEQRQYIEKTEELEEYQRQSRKEFLDLEVTTNQAPLNVVENRTVHFEATLEPKGDSSMKIEWFKDGQLLQASSRITTFYNFGYVALTIKSVDDRDNGVYTCVATNRNGSAQTSARLTSVSQKSIIVESQFSEGMEKMSRLEESKFKSAEFHDYEILQKPKFIKPLSTLERLNEGQRAHFETRLEPIGDPTMTVQWYHNGKPLQTGHRFITSYDFGYVALDILYVYAEDSGEYSVRAVNDLGEDMVKASLNIRGKPSLIYHTQLPKEMESGVMKIAEMEASWSRFEQEEEAHPEPCAPVFVTKLEPQVVNEGEPVKFSCRIVGHPRPRIFWVLNGNTVVSGSRYKLSYDGMYYLDIPRSRQYDQGKIEVFARNVKGEAYCWTTLEVKPKHDDYRVVLKNSPRPWYDDGVGRYQRERKATELEK